VRLAAAGLSALLVPCAAAAVACDLSGSSTTTAEATAEKGAASVFVSPSGSDRNPCSRAAPCRTLNRAYNLARPGEVVEVAAGRYPGERLQDASGSRAPPKVVIRPAQGARVSFTEPLELSNVRQLVLRDIRIEPFAARWPLYLACVSQVRLENVGGGRRFLLSKGTDVTIKGGSWGGYGTRGEQDTMIGGGGSDSSCYGPGEPEGPSRRITLDGVTFHDVFWGKTVPDFFPESHPDCLQLNDVQALTIRNSRFLRCAQVFIGFYGDGTLDGALIENNVFAKIGADSYYGTVIDDGGKPGSCANVAYRHNVHDESGGRNELAAQGFGFLRLNCRGGGVRVVGNIFHRSPRADSCGLNGAAWTHNVFERAALGRFVCGRKAVRARRGDAGFIARARNDYRLRPDSAAVDRGSRSDYPRFDLRGRRRYAGRAPDAGAYERGGR
jgi:Protein of unknown function (DUF1565)